MALQNVDGVLTGRGLMDCLQYYDICMFIYNPYFSIQISKFLKVLSEI
jgi:hypothetical protein